MSGDAGKLYRIASGLMDDGVPFDSLIFDYLLAAERAVGQRWAQGDYSIAEEHVVTATIETVISLLIGMFDQPEEGALVVVATAEGDDHSLPARAVAAQLVYEDYRTNFLGASVPSEDLGDFLRSEQPVALVLSAAMTTHLLGARAVVAAAHEAGVPVLVGGKAFGDGGRWAGAVGADAYVGSLRETSSIVGRWVEEGSPEINEVGDLPPALQGLLESRSAIVAGAEPSLDPGVPRLRQEVSLLLGAIEGAILTGDDQIVTDMLEWQAKSLSAHGFDGSTVADALIPALAEHSPDAHEILVRVVEAQAG